MSAFLLPVACGNPSAIVAEDTPSPTESPSPSTPAVSQSPSPCPAAGTGNYSDSAYAYSLQYPADFLCEEGPLPPFQGGLKSARFYDPRFKGIEPDGQVQVWVFSKDADDLKAWLDKHSAPAKGQLGGATYYKDVGEIANTQVGGRDAMSFVSQVPEGFPLHTIALFTGEAHVLTIAYFGLRSYEKTIKSIFEDVVRSLQTTPS